MAHTLTATTQLNGGDGCSRFGRQLGLLEADEGGIVAFGVQDEVFMGAELDNSAGLEDGDGIGMPDGGEAVAMTMVVRAAAASAPLHGALGLGVERAGGLVEE
ncbi:hypothetical protein HPP92_004304 [Vanilla planifolia]|uniref:Uncharacterized protein n=1 Tax=Vanilla planifolia TaxID=51239 RepID=A0A835RJ92_VANPL|nr:hypothetical protein HPP92_004304 [Vanilla planifolia]